METYVWAESGKSVCRRKHRRIAKYQLRHVVRTILTDDDAFDAIQRREDPKGHLGVFLEGKPVVRAATRALTTTFRRLAPIILPLSELVCIYPISDVSIYRRIVHYPKVVAIVGLNIH